MKFPYGIELGDSRLVCINCNAETELKHKARFLRRHPMNCVRAIMDRRKFAKELADGVRSVDDTERRGGKYMFKIQEEKRGKN